MDPHKPGQKIRQIAKKMIVITRFDDYYMFSCAKNYGCPVFSGNVVRCIR